MHAMANKEEHRGEGGAASAALVNDRSIGKDNKNNKRSLALSLQSHNLQPWSYPPKFFYPRSANAVPLRYCVSSMFRCEVLCTFTLCENLLFNIADRFLRSVSKFVSTRLLKVLMAERQSEAIFILPDVAARARRMA